MMSDSAMDILNFRDMFFFQAEDGIRDIGVTGVQTCALPICPLHALPDLRIRRVRNAIEQRLRGENLAVLTEPALRHLLRSEERRVGKECRSRWSPYH